MHGLGRESDDGICDFGGIHVSNSGSTTPLFVTDNIFHNITAFQNGGSGSWPVLATVFTLVVIAMQSTATAACVAGAGAAGLMDFLATR